MAAHGVKQFRVIGPLPSNASHFRLRSPRKTCLARGRGLLAQPATLPLLVILPLTSADGAWRSRPPYLFNLSPRSRIYEDIPTVHVQTKDSGYRGSTGSCDQTLVTDGMSLQKISIERLPRPHLKVNNTEKQHLSAFRVSAAVWRRRPSRNRIPTPADPVAINVKPPPPRSRFTRTRLVGSN